MVRWRERRRGRRRRRRDDRDAQTSDASDIPRWICVLSLEAASQLETNGARVGETNAGRLKSDKIPNANSCPRLSDPNLVSLLRERYLNDNLDLVPRKRDMCHVADQLSEIDIELRFCAGAFFDLDFMTSKARIGEARQAAALKRKEDSAPMLIPIVKPLLSADLDNVIEVANRR